MEEAREWLERGHVLGPSPDFANLGDGIAFAAIEHLQQIQSSVKPLDNKDLVSIAVDDMKLLTALMKLVVVFGVYLAVSDAELVPVPARVPHWPLPHKDTNQQTQTAMRAELSKRLLPILDKNDDVAQLILISPFAVDLLALTQHTPSEFTAVAARLPTFKLYRLLLQLRAVDRPALVVTQTLAAMPLLRRDAVRTLIELVLEPQDGNEDSGIDAQSLETAVLALASAPSTSRAKVYIEAVGSQLFAILSLLTGNAKLVEATALIVERVSVLQPKVLGHLRNLIVVPFATAHAQIENSLGALLNLTKYTPSPSPRSFTHHVVVRVLISLWLLVSAMGDAQALETSILDVMARCIEHSVESAPHIIANLLISKLPRTNLQWSIQSGKPPVLVESVSTRHDDSTLPSEAGGGMLKQIETRMNTFTAVVGKVSDARATQILVELLRTYATPSTASADEDSFAAALPKLLIAKAIESLSQNADIKPKLFSDPREIIAFALTLTSARVQGLTRAEPLQSPTQPPKLEQLTIADSDDEDEDGDGEDTTVNGPDDQHEDNDLLELALSLLGTALMEALADDGADDSLYVSLEHRSGLQLLATTESLPSRIRARADFCVELLSGTARTQKEVDMNDSAAMLKAATDALREPLVPSRAYGIHLISTLVERHEIELEKAMHIYGDQLEDDDSYVYLNAIRAIENAAKTRNAAEVIELLMPLISDDANIDKTLKAREALTRVLTPGSVNKVSAELLHTLVQDLQAKARRKRDVRLRLSSASILGIIIAQYPLSVLPALQFEIADCALGILRHEKDEPDTSLRRAAVALSLEVVNAVNEDEFTNVPLVTIRSLVLEIEELVAVTDDETLKDHSRAVLSAVS